ncbi:MAG TPA: class I SAM-dependent methyltransferase [Candidatus Limnocylindrales bacterium]|nr:class I SAM-dependent methyltransferase [Candidatus Limnocylindrales bacterium]
MTDRPACALLDAGDGRRLDRFGDRIVDRPAPAAVGPRDEGAGWAEADLRFDRDGGWWAADPTALEPWLVTIDGLTLELRPAAGGQVGLFAEQAPIWRWVADRVTERGAAAARATDGVTDRVADRVADRPSAGAGSGPVRVLHLFAYTGAATLAAARAGAAVVHVDGSRPAIAWARRNAAASGLGDRPIRWIVDDAVAFVRREARRGRRYDGIVLDPPSYGHGGGRGRGPAWRIGEDLPDLLAGCASLLDPAAPFVALSAHSEDYGPDRLAGELAHAIRVPRGSIEAMDLDERAETGALLPLGVWVWWSA